jgi:2-amino-4-hydroxy-6-hydroxymethyldihydropteridine diphosphokinase
LDNRALNIAYIGIGSNEGDRLNNIKDSIYLISKLDGSKIDSVSSVYETLPFGKTDQQNFYNTVIKIKTEQVVNDLFFSLKEIEKKIGRIQREKWGPREIDLDILFYNDLIFSDEIITLPHKGLIYRDFVIVPLLEIEPEIVHPDYNKKVSEFISELKIKNIINKFSESLFTEEINFDK